VRREAEEQESSTEVSLLGASFVRYFPFGNTISFLVLTFPHYFQYLLSSIYFKYYFECSSCGSTRGIFICFHTFSAGSSPLDSALILARGLSSGL
jgi:hypothetical protein